MTPKTEIQLNPEQLSTIFPVFQKGIRVETMIGGSLHDLFYDIWKLPREFVETRISTIFLNGKPVDDLKSSYVKEGAVIALSSAMPGLVGATLRRGSVLASFRNGISHREEKHTRNTEKGTITVKLFNMLIKELGPAFLQIGFQVDGRDLAGLFPGDHALNGLITVSAVAP